MAKPEAIARNKWKVLFRDRKTTSLWPTHRDVASRCKLSDRTYRCLKVTLEAKYRISKTEWFRITSGKEVLFPQDLQDKIVDIVADDKKSFLTIEVLSDETRTKRPRGSHPCN